MAMFAEFERDQGYRPLADRVRPRNLGEYIGQQHILGPGCALRTALEAGKLHSMIFWGPPGVGKTSLARLISTLSDARFETLSAVLSGVKDIRAAVDSAKHARQMGGQATVLFVDEVHRFNKSQQDAFLPFVEDGTVVFIGATTENPSFELNSALLSRARVYTLKSLSDEDLLRLLDQTLKHPRAELHRDPVVIADEQREQLVAAADGDARKLLNLLEVAVDLAQDGPEGRTIDADAVAQLLRQSLRRFDKGGDIFYDQISALHKSVRGSSPDAALYWMVRMLDGGCDPLYIARRLVRMASEDIGNADPRALGVAMSAWDSVERLGVPEGELGLAQAVVYLASAPKSNAVYKAYKSARSLIANTPSYEVPLHLRNAPTKLMKALDYGAEYRYAHDEPEAYAAGENYFPPELANTQLYAPVERGLEGKIKAKLEHLRERDKTSTIQRYSSDDSSGSR